MFSYSTGLFLSLSLILFSQISFNYKVATSLNLHSVAPMRGQTRIKRTWQDRSKALDQRTKNYPKNKVDLLRKILDQAPAKEVAMEFERVRSSRTDYVKMSDYDQTLLQAFVTAAVESKDSSRLVYLLSGKCPRYIGAVPIELYLAIISADNLLILFDSYEQSVSDDSKNTILEALSGVFRAVRQEFKDEKLFINASKEWYLQNRAKARVNPYYHPRAYGPITGNFFITK